MRRLFVTYVLLTSIFAMACAANDPSRVHIAAYDSNEAAKKRSDIVCTGSNDQNLIQSLLDAMDGIHDRLCELVFESGTYHIGAFSNFSDSDLPTAIRIGHNKLIVLRGFDQGALRDKSGARFVVDPSAYDGFPEDTQFNVIAVSNRNGRNFNHIELRNFAVELPDIDHKVIVLNTFCAGGATLENLRLVCNGRGYSRIPVEGLIGVRGQNVNPNGFGQYWKDIICSGFHEAFQMGGEHIVAIGLLAYQSYYGYTFGNYPTAQDGVWEHPITLINCSEELCASLPLFATCGSTSAPNARGLQCVDMISHTMELRRAENYTQREVLPARETVPGTWCGNITFAANRLAQSFENAVDVKFWEDGSGTRFKTRNSAHALAGTTAERLSYVPTYVQTYYDTDLEKMLIFDGRRWVDSRGKAVDRKEKSKDRRHSEKIRSLENFPAPVLVYSTEDGRFYTAPGRISSNVCFRSSEDLQQWVETSSNLFDPQTAKMLFSQGSTIESIHILKAYHAWRMFATLNRNGKTTVITLSTHHLCDGFKFDRELCEGTSASAFYEGRGTRYGYPWLCWCKDGKMYTQRLKEDFSALEDMEPVVVAEDGVAQGYVLWESGKWYALVQRGGKVYLCKSPVCNMPYEQVGGSMMESSFISAPSFDKNNEYFVLSSDHGLCSLKRFTL